MAMLMFSNIGFTASELVMAESLAPMIADTPASHLGNFKIHSLFRRNNWVVDFPLPYHMAE